MVRWLMAWASHTPREADFCRGRQTKPNLGAPEVSGGRDAERGGDAPNKPNSRRGRLGQGLGREGDCAKQSQIWASWGIWETGRGDERRANAPNKPNSRQADRPLLLQYSITYKTNPISRRAGRDGATGVSDEGEMYETNPISAVARGTGIPCLRGGGPCPRAWSIGRMPMPLYRLTAALRTCRRPGGNCTKQTQFPPVQDGARLARVGRKSCETKPHLGGPGSLEGEMRKTKPIARSGAPRRCPPIRRTRDLESATVCRPHPAGPATGQLHCLRCRGGVDSSSVPADADG